MKVAKASSIIITLLLLAVVLVATAFGAITGDVFGLFSFEVVTNFFVGFSGEQIIFAIIVALFTLVPNFGLTFFNWLKDKWGFIDKQAHSFILAVCFALSAIALLVTGSLELSGLEFNLANLLTTSLSVYGLSQLAYKRLFPNRS